MRTSARKPPPEARALARLVSGSRKAMPMVMISDAAVTT